MCQKILAPLVLFFIAGLISCNNSPTDEQDADSMARFAEDSNFRNLHETPEAIEFQPKGEMMEFPTPDGEKGSAYMVRPAEDGGRFLFLFHEWWGLNDQIKREADRLADSLGSVTVMAIDLYDGRATDSQEEAGKLVAAVKPARSEAIIKGALAVAGPERKVASIGWCFGGGWSLRSSILAGSQGVGCVIYYGMPVGRADELAPLQADILGIFAKKDASINEKVVSNFEGLAKATGKSLEVHWYDADHAFANPSSPRYNDEAAQAANRIALAFLRDKLK